MNADMKATATGAAEVPAPARQRQPTAVVRLIAAPPGRAGYAVVVCSTPGHR
jgi:hypothetical protein